MRNHKRNKIIGFSIVAIILAIGVIIPSVIFLFDMATGTGRNGRTQYDYFLRILSIICVGIAPSVLSIVLGAMAFSDYRSNKKFLPTSIKVLSLSALLISIFGFAFMFTDFILNSYVFR